MTQFPMDCITLHRVFSIFKSYFTFYAFVFHFLFENKPLARYEMRYVIAS